MVGRESPVEIIEAIQIARCDFGDCSRRSAKSRQSGLAGHPTRHIDGHTTTSVRIDQRQHPKCPTVVRTIMHEIAAPDVILIRRSVLRQGCAILNADSPEFAPSTPWLANAQNRSFEAVRQSESMRIDSNVAVVVLVQTTTE